MSLLAWWKDRSARKRARAEANHLCKEARRILRKKSYRIPDSVGVTVSKAVEEVEEALRSRDFERQRKAITQLDEHMDKHLAFARKSTIREYAESIGVAVFVALLLRAFVVEAFQIPSGSMIPTLEVGDHIFVSKFAYGIGIPFTNTKILEFKQPQRGDVIVFKFPKDTKTDYIKRVVGLPGDSIEVRSGELFINGTPVPREHIRGPCRYLDSGQPSGLPDEHECDRWDEMLGSKRHATIFERGRIGSNYPPPDGGHGIVPPGNVFVMGDNRDNSADSRSWGFVSHELIKGKALIVWWSRGPADGLLDWFSAIRWRRFFSFVD